MTYQSVIKKMVGPTRTLVLHTATLQLCLGSKSPYETTAFLERIIYFQSLKLDDDQWVYDTRETLMRELYFAERQLRNAITFLQDELQILQTQRRLITYQGKPATVTHFLVDMERLEFFLLHPEEVPSVKLTDPDIALLEEAQGPVGQIDRRGYDSLTDPASSDLTDAYKGTQSQTQSLTQSLIPPLPSVVSGGGEETQTPPVRKLRRKKSDLVPAPVLPNGGVDGESQDGMDAREAPIPIARPPSPTKVRVRSPKQQARDDLMAHLAPDVIGSSDPEAVALALQGSAPYLSSILALFEKASITTAEEISEVSAFGKRVHYKGKYDDTGINKSTWGTIILKYVGWRNSGKPEGTAKSSAAAAIYTKQINPSLPAADPDDSAPADKKDGGLEW